MPAVLDKDRARCFLPHALVTKRDGSAIGQIPDELPANPSPHESRHSSAGRTL